MFHLPVSPSKPGWVPQAITASPVLPPSPNLPAAKLTRPCAAEVAWVACPAPRCIEKGCVFPAEAPHSPKCAYHNRLDGDPRHFQMHQPTEIFQDIGIYVLDAARRITPGDNRLRTLASGFRITASLALKKAHGKRGPKLIPLRLSRPFPTR